MRALLILERVHKNLPIEDSTVELKAEWPDAQKAARRLAGHANAARSDAILWLIGVDEKKGVIGAKELEVSAWISSVQSSFNEGIVPLLTNVNVFFDGKVVCALHFDTTRAPFLVRNAAQGTVKGDAVSWEIPWREGNSTRTATRSEVLLILSQVRRSPKIEILEEQISLSPIRSAPETCYLRLGLSLYVVPVDNSPLVFPFHRIEARISNGSQILIEDLKTSIVSPPARKSRRGFYLAGLSSGIGTNAAPQKIDVRKDQIVEATDHDIVIRGPAKVELNATQHLPASYFPDVKILEYVVCLIDAGSDTRTTITRNLGKMELLDATRKWSS